MVENDHDKKNNTGAVTVGNQIKTEAQRNIDNAIARAPTGEDSGLAGMIATNTYSGENSAQAQQKKREKEAFQKVLNQSIQNQMDDFQRQIEEAQGRINARNKDISKIDDFLAVSKSDGSHDKIKNNPDYIRIMEEGKKRLGVKGELSDTQRIQILENQKQYLSDKNKLDQEGIENLKNAKREVSQIENKENLTEKFSEIFKKNNLNQVGQFELSSNVSNDDAMEESFIAAGEKTADTKEIVDDFGKSAESNFRPRNDEYKISVASSISAELSDAKLTPEFMSASNQMQTTEPETPKPLAQPITELTADF